MVKRILGVIGWIGTALVFIGAAMAVVPAFDRFAPYARPVAFAGLVCVLAYTAGEWREIAATFQRRQARYGALAGVSILVVLGILFAINYIGAKQKKRWDLTANKQFSLSDQTRNVLNKLDAPLQIIAFAQETETQRFEDRLKEYQAASKQITTEFVDPDKKPALARQHQVTAYNTIVFNYKGRTERVTSDGEQDITNAIIKVVSGRQPKIYFTQGHGEHDTTSSERDGYNGVSSALGKENYTVDKLVLAQAGSVPDDASVVVVAGPRTDFFPPEIDAIKKYLAKGGKLMLEVDPPDRPDSPALTNLVALAHDWGIDLGNDIVVDVSGMGRLIGASEAVPVAAPPYPSHGITQRFNLLTAYPLARSAGPVSGGVNGHTAQSFVETSARSWAETDLKGVLESKPVEYNEGKDKKGPVTIASAVSAPVTDTAAAKPADGGSDAAKPETRVAVFGDSDYASNSALGIQGNRDLFLNTIGWLSQQENLISIRPKEADDRRITMTAGWQNFVNLMSVIIIPACIFGAGVLTWWRRR
jgi:ABC-type uncharacterized transport system involved in gliding motility auxiliary subunit